MVRRHNYEYVKSFVEQKGGLLLSKKYKNNSTKLEVKCLECENIWFVAFGSLSKSWCPKCSKKRTSDSQRHDILYVIENIENRGGILLSKEYKNVDEKLKIKCIECSNIWFVTFCKIQQNRWCPKCAIEKTKNKLRGHNYEQMFKMIKDRGGTLLSDKYENNHQSLEIKCDVCNHIWKNTWAHIKFRNQWCPKCSSVGKSQKRLHDILEKLFPLAKIKPNYKGFSWLYNKKTKGTQEIDIWIPELKIAIEYDGEQHFKPVTFGRMSKEKADKELSIVKKRDRRKNRLMKKHTEDISYFIRFNYKESLTKDYVLNKLLEKGVPVVYNS